MSLNTTLLGSLLVLMFASHLVLGSDSDEEYGTLAEYDQSPESFSLSQLSVDKRQSQNTFLVKFRNWLTQLLMQRETRGGKRCGKWRRCYGVCCGGYRCCKKGWSCRYMNAIRTYTCIP